MRRTIPLLVIAVMSLLPAQSLHAQDYGSYLDAAYPETGPGAAAIVVKGGEVAYRGARGFANLELGVPLSPDHVFRIGSITKQFTAGAILLLADRGRLSVEDPISKYLPDYPTHGHTITIEHLLTHTSGIYSYTDVPGFMTGTEVRTDLTIEELIDLFDEYEMDFAPGEQWNYSNSGYVLLGAIIEAVSEQSYAAFVQENIFEPLGMKNSYYGGAQLIPRRVAGYRGSKGEYANADFISMTVPHAAGSLLSTVDDLWRWNDGLFNGGLLKEHSLARMTTTFTLNDGEDTGYGYGLGIGSPRGELHIHHGGGIHGFSTFATWLPESEIFVTVLANNQEADPEYVARQMAAAAAGNPYPERSAIELPQEKLAEYVGVYRFDEDVTRAFIVEEGRTYTDYNGSGRFESFAHAEDAFFYTPGFTYFEFQRDEDGRVARMLRYTDGKDEPEVAEKVTAEPEAPAVEIAEVSPELYDLWAGTYTLQPGFDLVISRDGERLMAQPTGQSAIELSPTSSTRYVDPENGAEIEFEPGLDGRAAALVLYQEGQEMRAPRSK